MDDRRLTLELHPAGEPGLVAEANQHPCAENGWHVPDCEEADEAS